MTPLIVTGDSDGFEAAGAGFRALTLVFGAFCTGAEDVAAGFAKLAEQNASKDVYSSLVSGSPSESRDVKLEARE